MKKKTVALLLACVMALGVAIGGTMAWLTDNAGEVKNTFTVGDINIDLSESVDTDEDDIHNYDFVPGDNKVKDPKVTVTGGSEACYLFVKVDVANNSCTDADNNTANPVVDWKIADGWTPYGNDENAPKTGTYYYYRTVQKSADASEFQVLACKDTDNHADDCPGCVELSTDVTKAMREGENGIIAKKPTLTFAAAAVQSENLPTATAPQTEVDVAFGLVSWPTT